MTIINNMFGGSRLYCSSSHPPRIIEDNPNLCGMDDLKLQTSQAGFWRHSLSTWRHSLSTWASLANISLGQSQRRCPHGSIMLSGKRRETETKQFQLGLLGSLATPMMRNSADLLIYVTQWFEVWTFELVAWPQSDETLIRSFFWYPAAMEYAKATTQTLGNQYLPPDLCLCRCRVWVKLGYTKLRQWPLSLQPAGAQADISAPISSKWNASGEILTTKFRSSWWVICLDTESQHRSHVSSHVRNESDFFF